MTRLKHTLCFMVLIVPWFLLESGLLVNAKEIESGSSGNRWYSEEQVITGRTVYARNCSGCHGIHAQGTENWKTKLPDGSHPPPPLDGTGHTWHHDMNLLLTTINDGGLSWGGKMPGFKNILNEHEKKSVIAYIQTYWSKRIYDTWAKNTGLRKSPNSRLGKSLRELIESGTKD
ncbi:c-type cytochrome [Pseudomonadota bacterium]